MEIHSSFKLCITFCLVNWIVIQGIAQDKSFPFPPFEKITTERKIHYIKHRIESFDDHFPCKLKNCKLMHIRNWLNLFIDYHNSELKMIKSTKPFKMLTQIIKNLNYILKLKYPNQLFSSINFSNNLMTNLYFLRSIHSTQQLNIIL